MPVNSFENYPMSWKPEINKSAKSLVAELAQKLEQDILNHKLLPGTKMPPYRELADYLDVNVSTITRAFKICRERGLLGGTVGSGTFIAYDALSNAYLTPKNKGPHIVEMGGLYPAAKVSGEVCYIIKTMLAEDEFDRWMQYGNEEGEDSQKYAALHLLSKAGCNTSIECMLPSSGGQNSITAILTGLFQAGDKIGVDPLTYPGFKTCAKMLGIELIPIRQENGQMGEEGIRYAVRNERIKALYVMPDFQNPTTHTMTMEGRQLIAKIAQEEKLLVIEDGANSLTKKHCEKAIVSIAPEQTVYIGSLSKAIAPGLRLAYIVVPLRYKRKLSNALYNINLTLSPFLTEVASRMASSNSVEQVLEGNRLETIRRNMCVNQYLKNYEVRGDKECIFRWLILPPEMTGEEFEYLAMENHVRVYAAERFAVGKIKPPSAVRISVTSPKTIEELEEGLKILERLLMKI